jgi:hypothetical protein
LPRTRDGGALETAQNGFDARQELAGGEGLGDVIVGAELKAEDAVVFAGASGDEDDGDGAERGVIAQATANVEAVAAGNHDVEQKQRGGLTFGVGNQIRGGRINAGGEAGGFKVMLDQAGDIGVILKHEDGLAQAEGSFPAASAVGGAFRPQPKLGWAKRLQKLC